MIVDLEKGLEFLCITAVKDLLQDDVNQSIVYTEQAKIKLWILTGDKVETAAHICKSTGLVKNNKDLIIINNVDEKKI